MDQRLLATRYAAHGNSHRRMCAVLAEEKQTAALERMAALRLLERRFAIDLGSLCHLFERRNRPATHPLERVVVSYIAEQRLHEDGREELWVFIDRVRAVRELIEHGAAAEAEGAAGSGEGGEGRQLVRDPEP